MQPNPVGVLGGATSANAFCDHCLCPPVIEAADPGCASVPAGLRASPSPSPLCDLGHGVLEVLTWSRFTNEKADAPDLASGLQELAEWRTELRSDQTAKPALGHCPACDYV